MKFLRLFLPLALAAFAAAQTVPTPSGTAGYLVTNGSTYYWSNIVTGGSGAIDCATTPGVCDIVTALVPLKAAANVWTGTNDYSGATWLKLAAGSGTPLSGCSYADGVGVDVGKVYIRTDAGTTNSSVYFCTNTAASTYSWELVGAGGGGGGSSGVIPSGSTIGSTVGTLQFWTTADTLVMPEGGGSFNLFAYFPMASTSTTVPVSGNCAQWGPYKGELLDSGAPCGSGGGGGGGGGTGNVNTGTSNTYTAGFQDMALAGEFRPPVSASVPAHSNSVGVITLSGGANHLIMTEGTVAELYPAVQVLQGGSNPFGTYAPNAPDCAKWGLDYALQDAGFPCASGTSQITDEANIAGLQTRLAADEASIATLLAEAASQASAITVLSARVTALSNGGATGTAPFGLMPYVVQQFFDNNGVPLAGGKLCTFAAGTTTPLATYSDAGLLSPNTNPVILDAGGRATVYFTASSYKVQLLTPGTDNTCATGSTIWLRDNVTR